MKKYIQIYSVLLLFAFIASCKAQNKTDSPKDSVHQSKQPETKVGEVDPYFTKNEAITTSYGPTSITRNIIQDRNGNIWLATWLGIIRYDGNYFTNFTNKEGLRRFRVFSILEDSNGIIWFGTIGGGVYRYDGNSFTNITTKDGLVYDGIGCIYEDKTGNIWFGTQDGVSKYDGKSFTNFTTENGLTDTDINSIIEDENGKLWFGTRGHACFYDGKTFTEITNKEGAPFVNVRTIIKDSKNNIWLGGNDGLWRYNGDSWTNFTKNFVGYIYEDKAGNIWTSSAGSNDGNSSNWALTRYDITSPPYETVTPTEIKAEKGMFFGIMEDTEENIWVGTLDGVYRYDGTTFNYFRKNKAWEKPEKDTEIYNQYKNGEKDGLWRAFYENGQLKAEGNYKGGKKEGLHREWESNGILSLEGFYSNGKANGLMKWFHEKGHLAGSGNMKDNIRVGPWTICDIEENGFCIEAHFKDGKRDGVWKINHESGKLWREQTWKDDKVVSEKCWDETGQEIECTER